MTARDATTQDATTPTEPTDVVAPATDAPSTDDARRRGAVDLAKPSDAVEPAEPAETDETADEAADETEVDATEAEAEATDAEAPAAKRRRARSHRRPERPGGRRRWPLVALLTVSALFAAAMVALFFTTRPADIAGLTGPQQAAVDAATQAAVNLQTFRRASFDQDFANALASLTPQFGQEQLAPRKDALKKQLDDGGRDATATALSAGLVSSTSTAAVVLVVTNTTQTSDNGQSTPFVFSRLQLTLQLTGGKWLVSDLKSVGLS